jgi:hypothetical protein
VNIRDGTASISEVHSGAPVASRPDTRNADVVSCTLHL